MNNHLLIVIFLVLKNNFFILYYKRNFICNCSIYFFFYSCVILQLSFVCIATIALVKKQFELSKKFIKFKLKQKTKQNN